MLLAYIVYWGIIVSILPFISYPLYSSQRIKLRYNNGAVIANKLSRYLLPTIIFTFALGLRYDVGVDYLSYESIYKGQSDNLVDNLNLEPIYALISFILSQLHAPYYAITCIVSFISFIFFFKSFKNYSYLRNWGFLFLFITGTLFIYLNLQRQAVAFFIFLYAIQYIQKQSFFKYAFWILIAMGFHFSAAILFPLYFIGKIKKYILDKLSVQLSLYFFIFILRSKLEILLIQIIFLFAPSRYAGYGNRLLNWRIGTGSGLALLLSHTLDLLNIILFYIINAQNPNEKNKLLTIQRIWFIGVYLELIFETNMVLSRIAIYMTSLKIILLAYICHHISNTWKSQNGIVVILTFFLIVFYVIYFIFSIKNGVHACSPYQFV